jgi:hypothetical protein
MHAEERSEGDEASVANGGDRAVGGGGSWAAVGEAAGGEDDVVTTRPGKYRTIA